MSKILCRDKKVSSDQSAPQYHSADTFLKFFDEKVKTVRSSTEGHLPPEIHQTAPASLQLRVVNEEEVRRIIMRSPVKSYRLDPIPTSILKEFLERLVSEQLVEYLQINDLMPRLQSAYQRHHSTETTLLRIISDLLAAVDHQQVSLLGLLDLDVIVLCP